MDDTPRDLVFEVEMLPWVFPIVTFGMLRATLKWSGARRYLE